MRVLVRSHPPFRSFCSDLRSVGDPLHRRGPQDQVTALANRGTFDKYMHDVALKLLLQSGEYETETREWSKLPDDHKTWTEWKATFQEAYVAKRLAEAAQEGDEKPFGGSAVFGASEEMKTNKQLRRLVNKTSVGPALVTNHMMDLLEGYLDNIAGTSTQTVAKGGPLAELATSLVISVDTVGRQ